MNDLNQIIFAGKIARLGELEEMLNGARSIRAVVRSERTVKAMDGTLQKEEVSVDIEACGPLSEQLKEQGEIDREIRVVGRLAESKWLSDDRTISRVYIHAEHIDMAPEKKTVLWTGSKEE